MSDKPNSAAEAVAAVSRLYTPQGQEALKEAAQEATRKRLSVGKRPLVLPQVNLNGSPRERLVEQQCDVMHAILALQKAMQEASPNGRDYQTMPVGTFMRAQAAWLERWQVIEDMRKEIEAHAIAIQES